MISSLASFLDAAVPEEALAARKAYNALRTVRGAAAAVDSAKALLITQRRTENVASRMEMPNTTRTAFLGILGQVTLAGPLLFMEIPTYSDINIKARYFGCFVRYLSSLSTNAGPEV